MSRCDCEAATSTAHQSTSACATNGRTKQKYPCGAGKAQIQSVKARNKKKNTISAPNSSFNSPDPADPEPESPSMTLCVSLVFRPFQREAKGEETGTRVRGLTLPPLKLDEVVATGRRGSDGQHERMAAINEDRKSRHVCVSRAERKKRSEVGLKPSPVIIPPEFPQIKYQPG